MLVGAGGEGFEGEAGCECGLGSTVECGAVGFGEGPPLAYGGLVVFFA